MQERITEVLGDRIGSVRVSERLTDSPVCLVVPRGRSTPAWSGSFGPFEQAVPSAKRIFEINPSHPTITNLRV